MEDINISRVTSTSQISSLPQDLNNHHHRRRHLSSSSPSSSFRGVQDDHWARQLIFPPFPGHRPAAISHPNIQSPGGDAAAAASLGFDPASLLHGGAKIMTDFEHYDCESEVFCGAKLEFRRWGSIIKSALFCRKAESSRRSRKGPLRDLGPSVAVRLRFIISPRRC